MEIPKNVMVRLWDMVKPTITVHKVNNSHKHRMQLTSHMYVYIKAVYVAILRFTIYYVRIDTPMVIPCYPYA